jgi:hypothetical protein
MFEDGATREIKKWKMKKRLNKLQKKEVSEMERLKEEIKKELGVNSGKELKEKLTKEMKELGLSKIDVIYHVTCTISNIMVYSIFWTFILFFFYHIDNFMLFNNKPIVFNTKTITQIVVIFMGCFLFFLLLTFANIIDFIFHYRLNRAISFRYLKDLKKYGAIKDIVKDIMKDLKKKNEEE